MVKNNIKNNIIDNLQDYQKERVIDYVEIGRSGKNFKNFNKISHKLQFNKLDKYSAKLIKEIYAPAISQMVNTVLHKDNLNSKEIKDTVSSYVKSLQKTRPLVDKELDLGL
ncbi:hypothetical protein FACS1894166_08360 [Bacilli bacterium]|nr:hypothetical protein FACS1894166_08360 [Bacilli bacterium]